MTNSRIAARLNKAIARAIGKPAGKGRLYAAAITRHGVEPRICAYYSADHDEDFSPEMALKACEYFEAGNPIRISLNNYLAMTP